jgi:hypothetical protein
MLVAQMVELSHMTFPAPKNRQNKARPKQIVRANGVLPPHPQSSVRPLHFFVISKKTVSRSDSAFHSRKTMHQDFPRKRFELQVKTAATDLYPIKLPTDYYMDYFNNFIKKFPVSEKLFSARNKISSINSTNIHIIINLSFLFPMEISGR